jgi:hypothetical protein
MTTRFRRCVGCGAEMDFTWQAILDENERPWHPDCFNKRDVSKLMCNECGKPAPYPPDRDGRRFCSQGCFDTWTWDASGAAEDVRPPGV